jgi:hypothetical protein
VVEHGNYSPPPGEGDEIPARPLGTLMSVAVVVIERRIRIALRSSAGPTAALAK